MDERPDFFRDFGILPTDLQPPTGPVRAYFGWGTVLGQYLATALAVLIGLGLAILFAWGSRFPWNALILVAAIAFVAMLVRMVIGNDYAWVELDGDVIRARYLYSLRVTERHITEIDDLLTWVTQLTDISVLIAEKLLGTVKGIHIRFKDRRSPIPICRADPAMRHAKQLIEAIVFRMSQHGKLDVEVVTLEGQPIVRRILWAGAARLPDLTVVDRFHWMQFPTDETKS